MTATVKSSETLAQSKIGSGPTFPGPNGNGSGGNGWHGKYESGGSRPFSPEAYRITIWVTLAAILMMFVALSSAYIVLSGGTQWRPMRMPRMFFLSTGVILASSATMEGARRSLKQGSQRWHSRCLLATLALGLAFVGAQLLGWRHLVAEGVYLSGGPGSSFYYLFTGVHGIHLLGGILALSYLVIRNRQGWDYLLADKQQVATDVISLYWHFMDGLWVWLFLLLLFWK